MSDIKEVELFIALDMDGDFGISGSSAEEAVAAYIGDFNLEGPLRVAKVTVRMSLPVVVEAEPITIPDEDTTIEVKK